MTVMTILRKNWPVITGKPALQSQKIDINKTTSCVLYHRKTAKLNIWMHSLLWLLYLFFYCHTHNSLSYIWTLATVLTAFWCSGLLKATKLMLVCDSCVSVSDATFDQGLPFKQQLFTELFSVLPGSRWCENPSVNVCVRLWECVYMCVCLLQHKMVH